MQQYRSRPPRSTAPTLAHLLEALLDQTRRRVADGVRSPATLEMQIAHARWWADRLGPQLKAAAIDEQLLELVVSPPVNDNHTHTPGPGPSTLRKRLSTLRAALSLGHRRGLLARVPALPAVLAPWRPRKRFLRDYSEARRLFESLPRHRAEWMWLCLWTGQHASDVERMTWADVGLFDRPPWVLIRNTKNRKEAVRVKIPTPLLEVLRVMWRRDRPALSQHLVRPWPSRHYTLATHCRRLGIVQVNAIDLRHTCLSWAVRTRGITPAVCAWAGHSSPVMMARVYAHALPTQLREVADDLSSIAEEVSET